MSHVAPGQPTHNPLGAKNIKKSLTKRFPALAAPAFNGEARCGIMRYLGAAFGPRDNAKIAARLDVSLRAVRNGDDQSSILPPANLTTKGTRLRNSSEGLQIAFEQRLCEFLKNSGGFGSLGDATPPLAPQASGQTPEDLSGNL